MFVLLWFSSRKCVLLVRILILVVIDWFSCLVLVVVIDMFEGNLDVIPS